MGKITVVGTGYEPGQLTKSACTALMSGDSVILRTGHSDIAKWLKNENIDYNTLDIIYEQCDDFDSLIEASVKSIISEASDKDIVYGVFDVRDVTVGEIMRIVGNVEVIPGPPVEGELFALASGDTQLVAASDWNECRLTSSHNTIFREIDTRELAAEVKLKLMEHYPEDCEAYMFKGGLVKKIPLYELDRQPEYDHTTAVMVQAVKDVCQLQRFDYGDLLNIVRRLREPGGCPWDRRQSHDSLRIHMIEEAYEVVSAIEQGDTDAMYDELGDVMLQVALHADIASEHGEFESMDVTSAICKKMINRHPHVFRGEKLPERGMEGEEWRKIKRREKGFDGYSEALKSIPEALPALMPAEKAISRAADGKYSMLDDLDEAVKSWMEAQPGCESKAAGELLLSAVNSIILRGAQPELALKDAVAGFIDAYCIAESTIIADGKNVDELDAEEVKKYFS